MARSSAEKDRILETRQVERGRSLGVGEVDLFQEPPGGDPDDRHPRPILVEDQQLGPIRGDPQRARASTHGARASQVHLGLPSFVHVSYIAIPMPFNLELRL